MNNSRSPRHPQVNRDASVRAPTFWEERAPTEKWNKTLPAIQIPQHMYEALQELAASPDFEYGGRIAPIIREAIDEFIAKYTGDELIFSYYRQMREFRMGWAEETMAHEMIGNLTVIEKTFERWVQAGEIKRVVRTFTKLMSSMNALPVEWRQFVKDRMVNSEYVKEAIEYVREDGDMEDKDTIEVVYQVLYE